MSFPASTGAAIKYRKFIAAKMGYGTALPLSVIIKTVIIVFS
jgi:hypothetical protein